MLLRGNARGAPCSPLTIPAQERGGEALTHLPPSCIPTLERGNEGIQLISSRSHAPAWERARGSIQATLQIPMQERGVAALTQLPLPPAFPRSSVGTREKEAALSMILAALSNRVQGKRKAPGFPPGLRWMEPRTHRNVYAGF